MFTSERWFLFCSLAPGFLFSFFFFFFCSGFFSHFLHLPLSCAVHWDILYSGFFYYCTSPIMMENSSSKIQYFCLQCFLSNREGRGNERLSWKCSPSFHFKFSINFPKKQCGLKSHAFLFLMVINASRDFLIVNHNFGILSRQGNNKNIQCIQHSPPLQPLGFL